MNRKMLFCLFASAALVMAGPAFAGDLFETVFVFDLSGQQEVPAVTTARTGIAVAVLNAAQTSLTVMVDHNVADATAAHIHGPAETNENADVVFPFDDPSSPIIGTWDDITPTQLVQLLNGEFYVNIHTEDNPGGEIRGQIVDEGENRTWSFPLTGQQVVPPTGSGASGTGQATLNGNRNVVGFTINHTMSSATAAHVRGPAAPGQTGPVVTSFTSAASPIMEDWTDITPEEVFELVRGNYYVSVQSANFPQGGLRGQISNTVPGPQPKAFGCSAGQPGEAGLFGSLGDLSLVALLLGAAVITARRKRPARVKA